LIYAIDAAGDQMLDIENLSDEELEAMGAKYEKIRAECIERESKKKPHRSSQSGGNKR
jgi:low affinity Fe/Cu permease